MDFKNKNLLIGLGALIIIAVVGGYFLMKPGATEDQSTTTPLVTQQRKQSPPSSELSASLSAQNNSGEIGIVNLTETNGKVMVDIALTGGTPALSQPAHIHKGTCAALDPKPLYPLANVVDGKSQTTIDNKTIAALKNEGPLAVNVHKSAQQASVYVACADLPLAPKTDNQIMQTPSTKTNSGY